MSQHRLNPTNQSLSPNTRAFYCASVLVLTFFLGGCASTVKQEWRPRRQAEASDFGQWRGRGSITRVIRKGPTKKEETWSIGVEAVSRTPGNGRIEVSGALGVNGGTVVWTKGGVKILLPLQKKFIVAENSMKNSIKALHGILPVDLEPADLEAVLFDREFSKEEFLQRGIVCTIQIIDKAAQTAKEVCRSENGFLLERTRGFEVTSLKVVSAGRGKLSLNFKSVQPKVEERPGLWSLEAPSGFKIVPIDQ